MSIRTRKITQTDSFFVYSGPERATPEPMLRGPQLLVIESWAWLISEHLSQYVGDDDRGSATR